MCAGLIPQFLWFPGSAWEREVHTITTELEKSIPSLAPCAAPPQFCTIVHNRVGTGKPPAARFWKIFWLPVGVPPSGGFFELANRNSRELSGYNPKKVLGISRR